MLQWITLSSCNIALILPDSPILLTKIIPPRLSSRMLIRPRILDFLMESLNYRCTLIQAGAGQGNSTALAAQWSSKNQRCGARSEKKLVIWSIF